MGNGAEIWHLENFLLLFLIGKNRHGIGGKGGYFLWGMGPKFGI